MKHYINFFVFLFIITSCKAQSPIIPLYQGSEGYGNIENAYYKDTFDDFDKFVGTWKYTLGNEELKIILKKKIQSFYNEQGDKSFYEDLVYGEYKYIDESGNELVNSLTSIDNISLEIEDHLIYGNGIVPPYYPPACQDCALNNERRLDLRLKDPEKEFLNYAILLRHKVITDSQGNVVETISLVLDGKMSSIPDGESGESRIPYKEYILIKQ